MAGRSHCVFSQLSQSNREVCRLVSSQMRRRGERHTNCFGLSGNSWALDQPGEAL